MSVLQEKSYTFALRMVKMCRYLQEERREYILSKQTLRSGTTIGALVAEAQYAQSKADFINKLHVALKEANETHYWLRLLGDSGYLNRKTVESLKKDSEELLKLLTSSINTSKANHDNHL